MNYPNGVKKTTKTIIKDPIMTELSHKNRGMSLESDINLSNEYYCAIDKAYIYKKPTPIKITQFFRRDMDRPQWAGRNQLSGSALYCHPEHRRWHRHFCHSPQ